MSRSYRTLALALAGLLVLVGLAKIVGRDSSASGASVATGTDPASTPTVIGEAVVTDGSLVGAALADGTAADAVVTDEADGDAATTSTIAPAVTATCSITTVLKSGASGAEVQCLEAQLVAAGYATTVDTTFDAATDTAVKAYQTARSLEADGIVGRVTAQTMGIWAGPLGPIPATNDDCPDSPHGAIVDRANQRGALCADGMITYEFPITTAMSQPDPGTYPIYAKDLNASSTLTGQYSTMTHFVAFTKGKYKGARIAFHSVPTYSNGEYIQPLDSVGTVVFGCCQTTP
jgi:peptidoglycan hydrolase-like protein with peptidoglycan-binding domain